MNSPDKPVSELISELESLGVTKEEIDGHLDDAQAKRAREMALPAEDSLAVVIGKLDKLQESVDNLAAKLNAE
jgi:hypothetical protein